ncbi:unnamed protein product, partial [Allacma fusca]
MLNRSDGVPELRTFQNLPMWQALLIKIAILIWKIIFKLGKFHEPMVEHEGEDFPKKGLEKSMGRTLFLEKNSDGIQSDRLVLMLGWLQGSRKHLKKYAEYYLDHRFDALIVPLPWYDPLWPELGAKMSTKNIAEFLAGNVQYENILVHAFSGGAYTWGEVRITMKQNQSKFASVEKRIVGQIFDSITPMDMDIVTVRFPKALLPHNPTLQLVLEKYLRFHLTALSDHTTRHYNQSFQDLQDIKSIKTPILVFASRDDHISSSKNVQDYISHWLESGIS